METKAFLTGILRNMERVGDLAPGAAKEIARDLPPPSGDISEDTGELFAHVYGRAARAPTGPDDAGSPEIPRSPYLVRNPATSSMPIVAATLRRLGMVGREDDERTLAMELVGLTRHGDVGAVAAALVERLRGDRRYWSMLNDPPAIPFNERRARAAIERLGDFLAPHVDRDALATEWADVGRHPVHQASRIVAKRLQDARYASDLCRGGTPPRIAHDDVAFDPEPNAMEAELRGSGRYES